MNHFEHIGDRHAATSPQHRCMAERYFHVERTRSDGSSSHQYGARLAEIDVLRQCEDVQ